MDVSDVVERCQQRLGQDGFSTAVGEKSTSFTRSSQEASSSKEPPMGTLPPSRICTGSAWFRDALRLRNRDSTSTSSSSSSSKMRSFAEGKDVEIQEIIRPAQMIIAVSKTAVQHGVEIADSPSTTTTSSSSRSRRSGRCLQRHQVNQIGGDFDAWSSTSKRSSSRSTTASRKKRPIFLAAILSWIFTSSIRLVAAQNINEQDPCAHHAYPEMGQTENQLTDGQSVHVPQIVENTTHRYFFVTRNATLMHVADEFRKLIINLEPCKGVVYLFVRKTRKCYPNPYSCMRFQPQTEGSSEEVLSHPDDCQWTHYLSVIDGTRDGAPTFFELPLTSTRYYIAVYAKETSSYTLTVLSDIGAWPRPGNEGRLMATQLQELQVQISWDTAYYKPTGITDTRRYWVYSTMLLERDQRTNAAVFLTKRKIMNTVCGLHNNTDRPASPTAIPASRCSGGKCNATIDGVVTGKRYVFNVIAESNRGYNMSYAGLILSTDWQVERRAASQQTLMAVGGVTGSIFAMVIVIYSWMVSLYGGEKARA